MADFGARWNYATADRRTPSPSPKRPRRDYERTYDDRGGWGGREGDQLTTSSDLLRNGLSFAGLSSDLGLSGVGLGVSGAASLSALGAGLSALDDSSLITQTSQMMGYDVACLAGARSNLNINTGDGLPHDASSTLFVDGLPSDCTRREAAHIFRPFIGFKEVRLVHKDAKRATGEKLVLCFVEFMDAKCAATALEALQGRVLAFFFPFTFCFLLWVTMIMLLPAGVSLSPWDGPGSCSSWETHTFPACTIILPRDWLGILRTFPKRNVKKEEKEKRMRMSKQRKGTIMV
ncbi:nuclear speckle RNA-binding protein A isoform X1 [Selaginella moellendorffii]|uniref:nuclear speckle RNA-binding protein A isoform X1 n=1 Tax=Selaginella moellendorffii TaxID=88036 RepID=UPI000D1C5A95|nr:nuclear speckle RNA-binding protein A isoform X1 [Selaginella moellendorffii]|eukprot:XP_024535289.1 nuclear speckle RNA-binding protein A isoform X1 [Selaginella moellendorffii]